MKVLIVRTDIDPTERSRSMTGIDSAITMEIYYKYNGSCRVTANHMYDKFTFIDEKDKSIGTYDTMDELLKRIPFLGNVLIVTHEQWLDKQNPEWRVCPRYQYW